MINFARQGYVNPFLSPVGAPFGGVNPLTLGQQTGGFIPTPFGYLPMSQFGQYNPLAAQVGAGIVPGINPGVNPMTAQFGQYNPLLNQIASGVTPGINPQTAQLGHFNPFVSQLASGFPQTINPFIAQTATNWPGSTQFSPQGVGDRTSAYGIDPRVALGVTSQQFGLPDPRVASGWNTPGFAGDPIALLMSQQLNPLVHQQPPIRSLINTPQNVGFQPNFQEGFQQGFQVGYPGVAQQAAQAPVTHWPFAQPIAHLDPYRAFIEAQLISQLATNPLYQLHQQLQSRFQQGYGAPEAIGIGVPGPGQQFNPLYGNAFCG